MRPLQSTTLLLPLLLLSVSSTLALAAPDASVVEAVARDQLEHPAAVFAVIPSTTPEPKAKSDVGTKDAPVDGKDGMPHSGPFVETAAERDRKQALEAGGEVKPPKPISNDYKKGQPIPESNDGVMDDPNRRGPKEGTRGTEGGMSHREKMKVSSDGDREDKVPDPPKEQPPLPHSEAEKIAKHGGDGSATKDQDTPTDPDVIKELSGLQVRIWELNF